MACIEDSFDRADGALGVADTGETWSTEGTHAIVSGRAYQVTTALNGWAGIPYERDVAVEGRWVLGAASGEAAVVARLDAGAGLESSIGLTLDKDSLNDRLSLDMPGAPGTAKYEPAGLVLGNAYTIRLELRGRRAWGYLDGALVLQHSFDAAADGTGLLVGFSHHRSLAYAESDAGGSRLEWWSACPLRSGFVAGTAVLG